MDALADHSRVVLEQLRDAEDELLAGRQAQEQQGMLIERVGMEHSRGHTCGRSHRHERSATNALWTALLGGEGGGMHKMPRLFRLTGLSMKVDALADHSRVVLEQLRDGEDELLAGGQGTGAAVYVDRACWPAPRGSLSVGGQTYVGGLLHRGVQLVLGDRILVDRVE